MWPPGLMEALRLSTCAFAYCVILLTYDGILDTEDTVYLVATQCVCVAMTSRIRNQAHYHGAAKSLTQMAEGLGVARERVRSTAKRSLVRRGTAEPVCQHAQSPPRA